MEDLARVDPLSDELVARRLDVGDDKVEKPNDSDGATTALLRLRVANAFVLRVVTDGDETISQ